MKKINIICFLYFLSYALIVSSSMLSTNNFINSIRDILNYIAIIILLLIILIQPSKYTKKDLIRITIPSTAIILSYVVSHNSALVMYMLFIIASKRINMDKFIKFDLILKILLISITILSWSLGFSEQIIMYRDDGKIRQSLGFSHPNHLGQYLFAICIDIAYLDYKKYSIVDYLIMIISLLISIFVCDSRAAIVGITLLILFSIIFPRIKNKKKLKYLTITPIALMIISFLLTQLYIRGNSTVLIINDLVSGRIRFAAQFLKYYDISLLGHYFEFYTMWGQYGGYLTVLDNFYMNILIQFGALTTIIIIFGLYKLIKYAIKYEKTNLILCIVVILIYGLMEKNIYYVYFNSLLIYLGNVIYENKSV